MQECQHGRRTENAPKWLRVTLKFQQLSWLRRFGIIDPRKRALLRVFRCRHCRPKAGAEPTYEDRSDLWLYTAEVCARNWEFSSNLGAEKGAELSLIDQHKSAFLRTNITSGKH